MGRHTTNTHYNVLSFQGRQSIGPILQLRKLRLRNERSLIKMTQEVRD